MDQGLEDLVGGGVGPLLTRQGQHAGDESGRHGGTSRGGGLIRIFVACIERTAHSRRHDAVAPGGVRREGTVRVDGGYTNNARPATKVRVVFVLPSISCRRDDDDTARNCVGDSPLDVITQVSCSLGDGNDLSTIFDGLVYQRAEVVEFLAVNLASALRHRIVIRHLIAVQRSLRRHTGVRRNQDSRHVGAVTCISRGILDGTAALVGDVGTGQLGGAGVDGAIDEGDGDALTGVALFTCSVEAVVGEVLLGCNGVGRVSGGRGQGEGTDSQCECGGGGDEGARGAPRPPHKAEGRTGRGLRAWSRECHGHFRW